MRHWMRRQMQHVAEKSPSLLDHMRALIDDFHGFIILKEFLGQAVRKLSDIHRTLTEVCLSLRHRGRIFTSFLWFVYFNQGSIAIILFVYPTPVIRYWLFHRLYHSLTLHSPIHSPFSPTFILFHQSIRNQCNPPAFKSRNHIKSISFPVFGNRNFVQTTVDFISVIMGNAHGYVFGSLNGIYNTEDSHFTALFSLYASSTAFKLASMQSKWHSIDLTEVIIALDSINADDMCTPSLRMNCLLKAIESLSLATQLQANSSRNLFHVLCHRCSCDRTFIDLRFWSRDECCFNFCWWTLAVVYICCGQEWNVRSILEPRLHVAFRFKFDWAIAWVRDLLYADAMEKIRAHYFWSSAVPSPLWPYESDEILNPPPPTHSFVRFPVFRTTRHSP